MKLVGWFGIVVVVAGTAAVTIGGCGGQGVGQRCSTLNVNSDTGLSADCADDLLCYSAASLGAPSGLDICCPKDRNDPNLPTICKSRTGGAGETDGEAPPPIEAGVDAGDASSDAADDADAS